MTRPRTGCQYVPPMFGLQIWENRPQANRYLHVINYYIMKQSYQRIQGKIHILKHNSLASTASYDGSNVGNIFESVNIMTIESIYIHIAQ
jgi:hypothetical protein